MRRSKGEAKQAKWQGEQGSAVEKANLQEKKKILLSLEEMKRLPLVHDFQVPGQVPWHVKFHVQT